MDFSYYVTMTVFIVYKDSFFFWPFAFIRERDSDSGVDLSYNVTLLYKHSFFFPGCLPLLERERDSGSSVRSME